MMEAKVKPSLADKALEVLKRDNPMALESLVADVVAEIVNSCRLDLSPAEGAEVRELLEGHMELKAFHSGTQGASLRARLAWEEVGSNLPISEALARKTDVDEMIETVDDVCEDDRFTVELLPASEFILDDRLDSPMAMTPAEASEKHLEELKANHALGLALIENQGGRTCLLVGDQYDSLIAFFGAVNQNLTGKPYGADDERALKG